MRWLGLDIGTKRIGVAVSDELGVTARGVTVVRRRSVARDVERIAELAAEQQARGLVVGLPLSMDGSQGRMAELASGFAAALAERTGLPVELHDERLTSWEAEGILKQVADRKRRRDPGEVDKLAAVLILRSFLAAREEEGA
ncbi:MAG: Holliday junction resolvase RuvX [Deltaproteobacteria bacterium]|nr:Holliday junction resolvase RuvX [Deltaproteobacteria bacterium]